MSVYVCVFVSGLSGMGWDGTGCHEIENDFGLKKIPSKISIKDTTKGNMSDPRGCDIVENHILRSFVQGKAEEQDKLGANMAPCLYSNIKSGYLCLLSVVFTLSGCCN